MAPIGVGHAACSQGPGAVTKSRRSALQGYAPRVRYLPQLVVREVYRATAMNGASVSLGDVLERAARSCGGTHWTDEQIVQVSGEARGAGLDAVGLLRLLDAARIGSFAGNARTVRIAYELNHRTLDRVLRHLGCTIAERRAALGLPPL